MTKRAPYVPFYPSDWLAGVADLSPAEVGVYINILACIYDAGGPIKADHARLARRMNCPEAGFRKIVASLIDAGKLTLSAGFVSNSRAEKELEIRGQRAGSAAASARVRWSKNDAKTSAEPMRAQCDRNANQNQNQNNPLSDANASDAPPVKSTAPKQPRTVAAKGHRLPSDWSPSETDRETALREGLNPQEVDREADRFRDFWTAKPGSGGVKLDWSATWRNWVRRCGDDRRGRRPPLVAIPGGNRSEAGGLVGASLRIADELAARRAGR